MSANHPAFPLASGRCDGLTKRELFAAMFLQASISICSNEFMMNAIRGAAKRNGQEMDDYLASHSVKTADRLIAELEKTND